MQRFSIALISLALIAGTGVALAQEIQEEPMTLQQAALTDGKASGYRKVTHEDYEPIIRMIKHNLRQRKSS